MINKPPDPCACGAEAKYERKTSVVGVAPEPLCDDCLTALAEGARSMILQLKTPTCSAVEINFGLKKIL